MSCLFCRIAAGEIPSTKVYEDELVYAFRDKKHIESAQALTKEDDALLCHMFACARKIAESEGVAASGYRLITNVGDDAGQSVHHLHLHLIGGKQLKWDN